MKAALRAGRGRKEGVAQGVAGGSVRRVAAAARDVWRRQRRQRRRASYRNTTAVCSRSVCAMITTMTEKKVAEKPAGGGAMHRLFVCAGLGPQVGRVAAAIQRAVWITCMDGGFVGAGKGGDGGSPSPRAGSLGPMQKMHGLLRTSALLALYHPASSPVLSAAFCRGRLSLLSALTACPLSRPADAAKGICMTAAMAESRALYPNPNYRGPGSQPVSPPPLGCCSWLGAVLLPPTDTRGLVGLLLGAAPEEAATTRLCRRCSVFLIPRR